MAWLGTWANRKKITIDNTNIDSDLTHFPVPIVLGTSVGRSDQDVSDIFDELGANSLKVAITKSDGTTQIYGEIEQWDAANEKAVIWVSKSDLTLSASSTNEIYLYYDANQVDNTDYIGTAGDTAAQNVWNSNYVAVYNMAQDPSGGTDCIIDSTSNANHGTPGGSMTSNNLVDADFGKALEFDGVDDYIESSSNLGITGSTNRTITTVFATSYNDTDEAQRIYTFGEGAAAKEFSAYFDGNDYFRVAVNSGNRVYNQTYADGNYHILTHVLDGASTSDLSAYFDGSALSPDSTLVSTINTTASHLFIGCFLNTSVGFWNGKIVTLLISNIARSEGWIKASYHAQTDNLITFGASESNVATALADMAMDIQTWQERMNNVPVDIHAASWTTVAISLDCHTALQSMSDTIVDLYALGERIKNQKVDISVGSIGIDNVMLSMQLSNQLFRNAFLDIFITDGTIRQNACMDVAASDGNKKENLGLDMMAVSASPKFKSVYAINLRSVIKEITA